MPLVLHFRPRAPVNLVSRSYQNAQKEGRLSGPRRSPAGKEQGKRRKTSKNASLSSPIPHQIFYI